MAPDTRDNVPCFAELPLQAVPAAAEAQSLVYSGSEAEVSYEVAQPVSGRSVAADPDLSLGTSSLVVTPEASQPAECASSTGAGGREVGGKQGVGEMDPTTRSIHLRAPESSTQATSH